ncbi:hypothetical protein L6164_022766 [Bauhinia variegata]|uniref:Uncharacterized protein n=1 Tax=Bauhinia variegata TaxID=167791 RepID=A0ACB9MGK7_BAUVA|nr:hypothetical protein L6164_022766 [Bauhinia variegata]
MLQYILLLVPINSTNAVAASSISVVEGEEIVSSHESCATPMVSPPPAPRANRDEDFDLDLEDIMVMETIWLSIQESGRQRNLSYPDAPGPYVTDGRYVSSAMGPQTGSSSSPSGGLACAIAALAERQQMGAEPSVSSTDGNISSFNML